MTIRRGIGLGLALMGLAASVAVAKPGDLDRSFSGDGKVNTDLGSTESTGDQANAVLVTADRRILVAGRAGNGTAADTALVRYSRTGALDSSLDGIGAVTEDVSDAGEFDGAAAGVVEPNGKIVVVGQGGSGATADFVIARFTPSGALDPTFNSADTLPGTNRIGFPVSLSDRALAIAREPDGEIVAAGEADDAGDTDFAFARFTAAGTTDNADFGTFGRTRLAFPGTDDGALDLVRLRDGRLLAAGYSVDDSDFDKLDFALVRLLENGSLDPSFNPGGPTPGFLTRDLAGGRDLGTAMAMQPDGKILVGGQRFTSLMPQVVVMVLARFNPDGTLDTAFGGGDGFVTTDVPGQPRDSIAELALQRDGRIVAVGGSLSSVGIDGDFAVARYLPNGAPDRSFSGDGVTTTSFAGSGVFELATSVAIDPVDGGILVAGSGGTDVALARYQGGRCAARVPTMTAFARNTKGTPKSDVIVGGSGKQTIRGRGGNDRLCGGGGRDRLIGGKGRDRLIGQAGRDVCRGGPGRDRRRGCELGS